MKNKFKKYEVAGFVFTVLFGTLLHFTYMLVPNNFVAAFSAVNESVWEHLKILFFPYIIYGIFEMFVFKEDWKKILIGKVCGVLSGMITVMMLFYTYTGVIGYNIAFIDISIFIIAAAMAFLVSYTFVIRANNNSTTAVIISLAVILLFIYLFIKNTFYPTRLPLFFDFQSLIYGIK